MNEDEFTICSLLGRSGTCLFHKRSQRNTAVRINVVNKGMVLSPSY